MTFWSLHLLLLFVVLLSLSKILKGKWTDFTSDFKEGLETSVIQCIIVTLREKNISALAELETVCMPRNEHAVPYSED